MDSVNTHSIAALRIASMVIVLALAVHAQRVVTVYVSTDFEYAEGILKAFEKKTGITVAEVHDTEDNKTVGLVNRIIAEGDHAKADVFWNNECGQTVRLKDKGLLAPYVSPQAATIPAAFKDADGYWTGFAARARVIIYNTTLVREADVPTRVRDLADPRFKGKGVMAKPLTGTTLTHVCTLYANDGMDRTDAWLEALIKNDVQFEKGNAQSMQTVSEGGRAFGMTDTDDARASTLRNRPTKFLYPDQGPDDVGVLLIPNTVMMLKGAPHPAEARAFIDYLLSPAVEEELARGPSAQIPLHPGVPKPAEIKGADELKTMKVDWTVVARMIDNNGPRLLSRFESAARSIQEQKSGTEDRTSTYVLLGILAAAFALTVVGRIKRRAAAA